MANLENVPAPLPDSARGGASTERVTSIPQTPGRSSPVAGWPAVRFDDPSRLDPRGSTPDPTPPVDRTGHPWSPLGMAGMPPIPVVPGAPVDPARHPATESERAAKTHRLFER